MISFLHPLHTTIHPPRQFTNPFSYEPHPLVREAAEEVTRYVMNNASWQEELQQGGKMFGVLVVRAADSEQLFFLAAFSGLLAGTNQLPYFVPPIYDLLDPKGYFVQEEQAIVSISTRIRALETDAKHKEENGRDVNDMPQHKAGTEMRNNVLKPLLEAGAEKIKNVLKPLLEAGAEKIKNVLEPLHKAGAKMRKNVLKPLQETRECVKDSSLPAQKNMLEEEKIQRTLLELKEERRKKSLALQDWLFDQYICTNAQGQHSSIASIFLDYYQRKMLHPENFEKNARAHHIPSGAGECCAPKLLQHAYELGLQPLCIGEWWMGEERGTTLRKHGHFYPACQDKCRPILTFMMQGLDVEESRMQRRANEMLDRTTLCYEDESLMVINKPSGVLSVPGRDSTPCVADWLKKHHKSFYFPAHRLDQDTSGLLLVAKTAAAYTFLQAQFTQRKVKKTYMALVDGAIPNDEGEIQLALRPCPGERPRQMVDSANGKFALTHYTVVERLTESGQPMTRLQLRPQTGRTHQLRVHCAAPEGLDAPILGDALYGHRDESRYPHLCLHASDITFIHPETKEEMTFHTDSPF